MGRYLQVLLPILACALAAPVAAESATYRVKFRFDGATGLHYVDPPGCPGTSRTGFDEFEGELKGDESEFATKQRVVYTGVMKRRTEIDACDLLPEDADGIANYCNVHLVGGGEFFVELTVHHQRTEVYFQARPRKGKVSYQANGSCEREIVVNYKQSFEKGDGFEHWIGPRSYSERDNVGGPPRAGTYRDQPPFPPHLPGHWTMTVGPPDVLRADAGGPYRIERGKRVRLDGSRSTGNVQSYTWTLTPKPCPSCGEMITGDTPQPIVRDGVRVELVALCDFDAHLVVADGQATDDDDELVAVVPRPFKTKPEAPVKGDFDPGTDIVAPCREAYWGTNICAYEAGAGQPSDYHYLHRAPGTRTWLTVGYLVGQVQDPDGLWDGWWYVTKSDLRMKRAELVHVDLGAGTCGDLLNDGSFLPRTRIDPFDRLREAVQAHEHEHTVALEKQLKAFDPAKDIETFVVSPGRRAALVEGTDRKIRAADSQLAKIAPDDAPVRAALHEQGFGHPGNVLFPSWRPNPVTLATCQQADPRACILRSYAETDDAWTPEPDTVQGSMTGCEGAPGGVNPP